MDIYKKVIVLLLILGHLFWFASGMVAASYVIDLCGTSTKVPQLVCRVML